MNSTHTLKQNHLLAELPADVFARLLPHLEFVPLHQNSVICEAGGTLSHAYFPTSGIVSLLYIMENGATTEIASTGNDGFVGVALAMGGERMPNSAVVQSAGYAYRVKASVMRKEFQQYGALQNLLLRYTQSLLTQMAQTAVCNRYHSIDQQLCRWLLLTLDKLTTNQLHTTQEMIANRLGVRREGVTEAARKLQSAGLIEYARGRITILDRAKLEERVCECYSVVKKEAERLLPYGSSETSVIQTRHEDLYVVSPYSKPGRYTGLSGTA
jgi:CRP-like cAMP-binding protein